MLVRRTSWLAFPFATLGCMPITGTQSEFLTPSSNGNYAPSWQVIDQQTITSAGNGVAFAIGTIPDEGFIAVAGLIPGSSFGTTPGTGSAVMSGAYQLLEVTDVSIDDDGNVSGTSSGTGGNIDLVADFDNGTLAGVSGELTVNGVILPTSLDGTVEWRGFQGLLDGRIDASSAVGAFHGSNDVIVFSGGFAANVPQNP